jgi:hypothetical protein
MFQVKIALKYGDFPNYISSVVDELKQKSDLAIEYGRKKICK